MHKQTITPQEWATRVSYIEQMHTFMWQIVG